MYEFLELIQKNILHSLYWIVTDHIKIGIQNIDIAPTDSSLWIRLLENDNIRHCILDLSSSLTMNSDE